MKLALMSFTGALTNIPKNVKENINIMMKRNGLYKKEPNGND